MITGFNPIKRKLSEFYQENMTMPDVEECMSNFLHSEIINDLLEKNIRNCEDWLKYYSSNGNNFEDIVNLTEGYYFKALQQDYDNINLEEKVLAFNVVALYCIEMDIEKPTGRLVGTIISSFIEIVRHYNLFLKGYLSMRGEVLISNRTKVEFYSLWTNGSTFVKEMPITLFPANQ
jgi:hypothetical protein